MSPEAVLTGNEQTVTDRRWVTVLCADLIDFTVLAEGLDPEELREIQAAYFTAVTPPITAYGGIVEKYIGDAVLAVFGAPQAHEDDPERAVRAALAMHHALHELNRGLEARHISPLAMRIGLHCGLVVATVQASGDVVVTGDAVNLASRLQTAAEPGSVLVSAETYQFIAHAFLTIPSGPFHLKGKPEPVVAYRVLGPRMPSAHRDSAGRKSPLIGRQAELGALATALNRLQSGTGGIVTIAGEAGLGKSRLVAEARRLADASSRGPRWFEGRCLSYGGAVAYQLWLDLLRNALGSASTATPGETSETLSRWVNEVCPDEHESVFPHLARLMLLPLAPQSSPGAAPVDFRQLKLGSLAAIEMLIVRMTDRWPLAIICEDLQWADASSLELLEGILPLIERVPLLVVCVFRPHREHGSWRLGEMVAQRYAGRHTAIPLQPLSPTESEALLHHLLGVAPPRMPGMPAGRVRFSSGLLCRVIEPAEGNPFFVEEITRALIGRGEIVHDAVTDTWQSCLTTDASLMPDSVHGVLAARIDRLPETPRRILRLAAVIGRIFSRELLAAIVGEGTPLDAHLLTLQREELLRPRGNTVEGEFIFKHELTREAAYAGLLLKERRLAHRQVAEALEHQSGDGIERKLGALAYHWERADEPGRAVSYLLRAGDQARLAYASQEAIQFYQRALTLLKAAGDDENTARTLMRLGLVYGAAFDFRQAEQVANEGFALWRKAMARGTDAQGQLPPPQVLHLSWYGGFSSDTLPLRSTGLRRQMYAGLVEATSALEIVPAVAEGWDVSEDGRTYTFHLRPDARWSDGAPVTAADFLLGWRRSLDPSAPHETASLLDDVRGAQAFHRGEITNLDDLGVRPLGPHTLRVELNRPAAYFLHILALPIATPLPSHLDGADSPPGRIVSNGPFVAETIRPHEILILARNPAYCGRFTGNVVRVEIDQRFTAGQGEAMLEVFRSGGYDACNITYFPPEAHAAVHRWHTGEILVAPSFSVGAWVFNVTQPPFADIRLRRACQCGVDVCSVILQINEGRLSPGTGGWIPPGMPGHSPGIAPPFDLAEARRLMAEAGFRDGVGFPFTRIMGEDSPAADPYSAAFRKQLRDNLGIIVERWKVGPVEREEILREAASPPANLMWLGIGGSYPDPDSVLRVTGERIWRMVGRRHAEYDRLVEAARGLRDHEERMALYRQADAILVREAYVWPHLYGRTHLMIQPWVKRYPVSPLTTNYWKDVVIEPH